MLRLLRSRPPAARATAASLFRAVAASDVSVPQPLGARAVRTARGGKRRHKDHLERIAMLEELDRQLKQQQDEQRQRALEARKQPPVLPAFIRVRDLAKALHRPLDVVLKRVVTRANRRFRLKAVDHPPAEFRSVKEIVLPFRVAQDVAAQLGIEVAYDDVEPTFSDSSTSSEATWRRRQPVIAVMGHVDHGKTTLMDTLRKQTNSGLRQLAPYEKHGITQKINVCEATLAPDVRATFLDTPGHFHFFRMRSSAAQVADAVLLIVAADEGVLLQTEESIGAIEDAGLPTVICINKVDLLEGGGTDSTSQVNAVVDELRSFVALQDCPVLQISAKTGAGLDELRHTVGELVAELADRHKLDALVGPETHAEGLVLESVALRGRGTVLRVLLKHGELAARQHFVAGMIHGVVRSIRDAEGRELKRALPGTVVDVTYSNKSKNVDAPNEHGFFVLPEARAKQVVEQRQLALELEDCLLPHESGAPAQAQYDATDAEEDEGQDVESGELADAELSSVDDSPVDDTEVDDDEIDENDLIETMRIIVKADGAGSLTSIQDTVDEMQGISTVRLGIGNISTKDIDVAINGNCPIFGFNVKLRRREAKLAAARGVRVVLRSTVHGLIEEITALEQAAASPDADK
ncbi:hypothetical protein BBJ28_00014525 [Nothophytophthora sp. Chile5]|nr:hypothetical protein BBJ28_00014525 [Nothophytophthora sp. Chile5]